MLNFSVLISFLQNNFSSTTVLKRTTQSAENFWRALTFDMTSMIFRIRWRYSLRYTVKKVAVSTAFPATLHPHPAALGPHTVQQVDNNISTNISSYVSDQGDYTANVHLWFHHICDIAYAVLSSGLGSDANLMPQHGHWYSIVHVAVWKHNTMQANFVPFPIQFPFKLSMNKPWGMTVYILSVNTWL